MLHRGLRDRGDAGDGGVDAGARLEEDLDDRDAGQRLALDVLDVVHDGADEALEVRDDALLHLLRRQAAVVEHHRDHRDVDLREDVGRDAHDRQHADDDDQHRHDDEGVGALERDDDEPHAWASSHNGRCVPYIELGSPQGPAERTRSAIECRGLSSRPRARILEIHGEIGGAALPHPGSDPAARGDRDHRLGRHGPVDRVPAGAPRAHRCGRARARHARRGRLRPERRRRAHAVVE